jgi:GDP-L-fucose synthase
VIADLIRKMHESPDEIVLWGDGSPTREFLYVEDAAEAFYWRPSATTAQSR